MTTAPVLLLVDDDDEDALILDRAIRGAEERVQLRHLSDGPALLDQVRRRGMPPRCIVLLDLNMPRMDGFAVLERLRSSPGGGDLPVVVYSTAADQHQIDRAYASGANAFITKPGSLAETRTLVSALVTHWFEQGRLPSLPTEENP